MKNIILIGMPGTGKSVVGQALAERLGYAFVDADDLIVEAAGKTLPEILRTEGVDALLAVEGRVGQTLDCSNTVVATGGSMVLSREAMDHLRENGVVVWLETPLSQISDPDAGGPDGPGYCRPAGDGDPGDLRPAGGPLRQVRGCDRSQPFRRGRYRPSGGGSPADRWHAAVKSAVL